MTDATARPDDLGIARPERDPLIRFGVIMPDLAFQNKGHDFETLMRVDANRAVGPGLGIGPIKEVGIWLHQPPVAGETDGLVFDDFAAIESAGALFFFGYDLDCHGWFFFVKTAVGGNGLNRGTLLTSPESAPKNRQNKTNMKLEKDYLQTLENIKGKIREAQYKAVRTVNAQLLLLYWEIGRVILQNEKEKGWGAKVIKQLSNDLRKAFPKRKGFSVRNLQYMRAFANVYPDSSIVQQAVAQLPWGHCCTLITKVKDPEERAFYYPCLTLINFAASCCKIRQF